MISKGKKGVVDVQFNWIFVLIAGFVMFLFIISIVFSQKDKADRQASIYTSSQITTLLKSKQQAANVYSEISIPNADLEFRCDPVINYSTYRFENSERTELPTEIIFAPQQVTTNKLIIWTQAFDAGFPVTTFSYITAPDRAIIIYADNDHTNARQIISTLPSNMSKFLTKDLSKYDNFAYKTVVCFDDDCPSSGDYINILYEYTGKYSYGNIKFKKGTSTITRPFVTDAAVYGAIFSGDANYYTCEMSRVMKHYDIKRMLLDKRMNITYNRLNATECGVKIRVIMNSDISPLRDLSFTRNNAELISNRSRAIDIRNTDLGFSSCPRIY